MAKVTKEKVKEWEKVYGEVRRVDLPALTNAANETILPAAVFYLKKPARNVIKLAMANQVNATGSIDIHTPGEVMLKNCFVGGDDVQTDDRYFFRACREATAYMNERLGF